jgi:HTH-type transcriptional regulator/antitoxin HigA
MMDLPKRPAEVFPPGAVLQMALEREGWSQTDLAEILGRPIRLVNEIVAGKRAISPETAHGLAAAFRSSPEFWMAMEAKYQLWRGSIENRDPVLRRARLYKKVPIKEVIRRGWIDPSDDLDVLEKRVCDFLRISAL